MISTKTDKELPFAFDKLTLGVVKSLEERPGVCNIVFNQVPPVLKHQLVQWEQKYTCVLPDDVRNFYLTCNGLKLQWSVKVNDACIPVGRMEVNCLQNIVRIGGASMSTSPQDQKARQGTSAPTLKELDDENEELQEDDKGEKELFTPKFDHRSRLFELDHCEGCGKICLVYNNTKPGIPAQHSEIWFLDRALQWHHMTTDFTDYYRILLLHLGLPQWQYNFTEIGLSPPAKQWFRMFAPARLNVQGDSQEATYNTQDDNASILDIGRVFKGKGDKKKPPTVQATKKKPLAKASNSGIRTLSTGSQVMKQGSK